MGSDTLIRKSGKVKKFCVSLLMTGTRWLRAGDMHSCLVKTCKIIEDDVRVLCG
jgi:hypothetical protein